MYGSYYMFRHNIAIFTCAPRTTSLDTTRHIHNILSTSPRLSIFQKALGTFPEDDNVMPKHVGATIHN